MKYTGIYILLTVLSLLAACTGKLTEGKVVTVTIEPQRFFAEKIAGDKFAIHCVVPSGQSPETYDPTPRQMVQIGQSEAYLQIGHIGFEQDPREQSRFEDIRCIKGYAVCKRDGRRRAWA